jgi:alpha-tubulin suppressor-like RCC1 family protein
MRHGILRTKANVFLISSLLIGGCTEFTDVPERRIEGDFVATTSRSDTVMVGDTFALQITLQDAESGQTVNLRNVEWVSSDERVLQVSRRPIPATARSLADTLKSYLYADVIARGRGSAEVAVTAQQEGVGGTTFKKSIRVLERWVAVSAGGTHTCALNLDREAYCWGGGLPDARAGFGVGSGRAAIARRPTRVLGQFRFSSISAGDAHTCGVEVSTDVLYCWGDNTRGALGDGTRSSQLLPVITGGRAFVLVSAGNSATCGTTSVSLGRNTFCWGKLPQVGTFISNPDRCANVLGLGTEDCITRSRGAAESPAGIVSLSTVAVGGRHACGISGSTIGAAPVGAILCWGDNTAAQLGTSVSGGVSNYAFPVRTTDRFSTVSAGYWHTCAISQGAEAFCWGDNQFGQLGVATKGDTVRIPQKVPSLSQVTSLSAAGNGEFAVRSTLTAHTCAISGGVAYCWGSNTWGQLGTGNATPTMQPTRVANPSGGPVAYTAISAAGGYGVIDEAILGTAHTCGLTTRGVLYCWGGGSAGELGIGTASSTVSTPTRVSEPDP